MSSVLKPTERRTYSPNGLKRSRRPFQTISRISTSASQMWMPVAMGAAIGVLWEILVKVDVLHPIIFPAPSSVWRSLVHLVQQPFYWEAVRITTVETVAGFILGTVGGFVLGALSTVFRSFRMTVYPYVIAFQNLPRVALAPVFLTWFGFGYESKIVMAGTIAFFPLVISTVVGLDSVAPDNRVIFRSYGASRNQIFWRLVMPSALPVIFSGVKQALTLSLVGAVVAEFVGGSKGLGVLVKQYNFEINVAAAFAVIFTLSVLGLLLYGVVAFIDSKMVFWRHSAQD